MGRLWPCSRLDIFLHRFSPWFIAPFSILVGGLIIGASLGVVAVIALMGYICTVWLIHVLPCLACSTFGFCRGRHAVAQRQAEAQRRVQARLLEEADMEAQARARAHDRAVALEQSSQSPQHLHPHDSFS
jgi:hypothetical protein